MRNKLALALGLFMLMASSLYAAGLSCPLAFSDGWNLAGNSLFDPDAARAQTREGR